MQRVLSLRLVFPAAKCCELQLRFGALEELRKEIQDKGGWLGQVFAHQPIRLFMLRIM